MTASVLLSLAIATQAVGAAPQACAARSAAMAVPLVEMYTAEGCNTCPPADRWFSRQVGKASANWLAFHVDYWDSLGWRDRFASPAHSRRQRERAWAWSSATVYTPQVMVGPGIHAPWRSESRFAALLRTARVPARAGLAVRVRKTPSGVLHARVAAVPVPAARGTGAQLWLARWIDGQRTAVRAGENAGVRLRHDRVVQGLWGPWPLHAGVTLHEVELAPAAGAWGLVAFVQDARGDTLQTLNLEASTCTDAAD